MCSGILAKYSNLTFITHHAGGMIPFFAGRLYSVNPAFGQEILDQEELDTMKSPIEQLKMFYNDTAIYGNTTGLMCAHAFFGSEHLLFGTDVPYGPGAGEQFIRATIDAVDSMSIPDADKKKIYEENAKALLRLDV